MRAAWRRGRPRRSPRRTVATFQVTATPARHGPAGIEPLSGEVVGFLVGVAQPGDLLYVTGDTVWYQRVAPSSHAFATVGLAERLTLLQPGQPVRVEV